MIRLTLKAETQEELTQMIADMHATFNGGSPSTIIAAQSNMEAEKPKATRKRSPKKVDETIEDIDVEADEEVEEVIETPKKAPVKAKTIETPEEKAFDYEVLKAKVLSFSKDPANRTALLGILKKFGVDHATKLDAKDWKAAHDLICEAEEQADLA